MDELVKAWIDFGIALDRDDIYPITLTFSEDWTEIKVTLHKQFLNKYWEVESREKVLVAVATNKIDCLKDITKQINDMYKEY